MAKKISFCTTCKGRLWQLQQTLPQNIRKLDKDSEIVILDYQSPDGLKDWLFGTFPAEIEAGKLKYFRLEDNYNYSSSYAKNVAHKLATGEILFNLDADNYIYTGLLAELRNLRDDMLFLPRLFGNDEGSYGRLGYTKATFERVGGYDETIVGMKGDDGDFRTRCFPLKIRPVHALQKHVAIQNTPEQKELYTDVPGLTNPPVDYPATYGKATVTDKDGNTIEL
jgi:glycosyltransferase involved in cell wall biosynthesis